VTLSFAAGATDTLIQAGAVARDGHLDLITTDANDVTLARSLKAMEFGRRANLSVRTQAGAGDATLIAGFVLGGAGVLDLAPGAYTATVSGKAGTTGVALVDVYELP
jgi:nicotinic acid phosphoribosyltransferase